MSFQRAFDDDVTASFDFGSSGDPRFLTGIDIDHIFALLAVSPGVDQSIAILIVEHVRNEEDRRLL